MVDQSRGQVSKPQSYSQPLQLRARLLSAAVAYTDRRADRAQRQEGRLAAPFNRQAALHPRQSQFGLTAPLVRSGLDDNV